MKTTFFILYSFLLLSTCQQQQVQLTACSQSHSTSTKSSAKESEIKFYMYPDNFLENSKLYNLTEEDITEKLTHTDTHL